MLKVKRKQMQLEEKEWDANINRSWKNRKEMQNIYNEL